MAAEKIRSEDQLGHKWDRCLADTSIKIASGLGLGIVFSVLFFRRRPWPAVFGTGIGLGMGYANCEHDFKDPHFLHAKLKQVEPAKAT